MSSDISLIIKEKLQLPSSKGTRHKLHSAVTAHFLSLMMHQCRPVTNSILLVNIFLQMLEVCG